MYVAAFYSSLLNENLLKLVASKKSFVGTREIGAGSNSPQKTDYPHKTQEKTEMCLIVETIQDKLLVIMPRPHRHGTALFIVVSRYDGLRTVLAGTIIPARPCHLIKAWKV